MNPTIIEWYRRKESSVGESLIEMYLTGVFMHRVEDIMEALWDNKASPSTISKLNKNANIISRSGATALTGQLSLCLCGRNLPEPKLGQQV